MVGLGLIGQMLRHSGAGFSPPSLPPRLGGVPRLQRTTAVVVKIFNKVFLIHTHLASPLLLACLGWEMSRGTPPQRSTAVVVKIFNKVFLIHIGYTQS